MAALHQARGCVPSASSGQAGRVERSCTKWLGLCLVLPAVVAVPMGGCQTLLHRQLIQRCGWLSLPSKGTASLICAMASNLAIADPCSVLDWPAVNPDHGLAFCPGMDMAWKARQNCSVPVIAQPRAGDITPKEGPKAGGHSLWSEGKPGPCPIPSNLRQVFSGGFSYLWISSVLVTRVPGRLLPHQRFQ